MNYGFSTVLLATFVGGVFVLVGLVGYQQFGPISGYIAKNNASSIGTSSLFATKTLPTVTSTESSGSTTKETSKSRKQYHNQKHGFAFSYPEVYHPLTTREKESQSALISLEASAPQYPKLIVSLHRIDEFSAGADTDGTWPRYYSTESDEWVARAGNASKRVDKSPVFQSSGHSVYRFDTGNIAERTESYAVPLKSRGEIIEVSLVHFHDNSLEEQKKEKHTTQDVNAKQIIKSLQFGPTRNKPDTGQSTNTPPLDDAGPSTNDSSSPVRLDVPEDAFGGKRVFTSISRASYSQVADADQPNLRPVSPVIIIDTNENDFQKEAELSLRITKKERADRLAMLGIYHKRPDESFEKITSLPQAKSRVDTMITEPGVYAVLGKR